MTNGPKIPRQEGIRLPDLSSPAHGEWDSVPGNNVGKPEGLQGNGDSYVSVDPGAILEVRADSRVARSGGWGAAETNTKHVALARLNLGELDNDARLGLARLLDDNSFTFHEFINGAVGSQVVSDILLGAEQIVVSTGRFESLESFLGRDAAVYDFMSADTYGMYLLPTDEQGVGIARALGWSADTFSELIRMARVGDEELRAVKRGEALSWNNIHITHLYRMIRLLQERRVYVNARGYLESVLKDQGFGDRITLENLISIYGKASAEDLDFFDVVEVLLNATWGDERILVSRKAIGEGVAENGWYNDKQDHVKVTGKALAETASQFMQGEHRNTMGAAMYYAMLAEDHLHGVGPSEGRYDFFDRGLFRRKARRDVAASPELYYDDVDPHSKRSKSGRMNNKRALERLGILFGGTDFEEEARGITDAQSFIDLGRPLFRDMKLDTSWVQDRVQYARATLYALVAVARFKQAGEEAMDTDPKSASTCFRFAMQSVRRYMKRCVVLGYISDPLLCDLVRFIIIQPFDMLRFDEMCTEIRKNQRRVDS